ncbi:MAG TPA: glycosyltransferase family 2 protein, partial [Bacteroidales bacterium]|nr:glycosyltransferase family 2 protein [Bacteroidales bacterium]
TKADILTGAFMFLRREAFIKTGYLDEDFFMYGEDIDLSYRITQAGYRNYYFPEARIIHYKGESTKKASVNYVFTFYQAMIIFARKHFSQKNARLLAFMIHLAIWFRASLSILWRFARNIFLPLTDAVVMFVGFLFLKNYWEATIKYVEGGSYPIEFITIAVPSYIFVWLLSVYFCGGYDRPVKLLKLFQGLFFGTVTILVIYGLLSEEYRFSRALIILGAFWGLLSMTATRFLLQFTGHKDFKLEGSERKRYAIVGEADECERVAELLRKTDARPSFIGLVRPGDSLPDSALFLGNISQLRDIITIYQINEVVFCARDITSQNIIDTMTGLNGIKIEYKIAPPESMFVIGSSSINTSGDLYMVEINNIARPNNRRSKRLFDVAASLVMLLLWPLGAMVTRKPRKLLINIMMVLTGFRSWVGYSIPEKNIAMKLPSIRKGILTPADSIKEHQLTAEDLVRLNILYARNYRVATDINTLVKGFTRTGGS